MNGGIIIKTFKNIYTKVTQVFSFAFFNGLLVLTIAAIISMGLCLVQGKEITFYGYKPICILTGSMEPEIKQTGTIIVKELKDPTVVQVGDIITYRHEDVNLSDNTVTLKTITHRIVNKDEASGTVRLRGDGNSHIDSFVQPDGTVTEDIKMDKLLYTHKYTWNWTATMVAFITATVANIPLAAAYLIALISALIIIRIIHKSLYVKEYEFHILRSKADKKLSHDGEREVPKENEENHSI